MTMIALSKNLFRRFYSCSSGQSIIGSRTYSFYLLKHFDSRFDNNHQRYYCSNEKWITIIFKKTDGTRVKRKGKAGETLYDVICGDPDFPGFGQCQGTQSCSTCHVIFTKEDFTTISKYNSETPGEGDLLDEIANRFALSVAQHRTDTSRLGCCIELVPEMDGMVIKLPKTEALTADDFVKY